MNPIPLYINIQIQKKFIIALARSENGFVPVIEASKGPKNIIKIEINIKIIPNTNHIFFHICSETNAMDRVFLFFKRIWNPFWYFFFIF